MANDLAGFVDAALRLRGQVMSTLIGPPMLDRFEDDLSAVWEPFLTDDR